MEELEKQLQITKYLDRNYYIKENSFINKFTDHHDWGNAIYKQLLVIFCFKEDFTLMTTQFWAYNNGFDSEEWEKAWGPKQLKTSWSPDMAQDVANQFGFDAEEHLTRMLSDELAREIDAQILRDLRGQFKTGEDLLGVVKCLGYEPMTIHDPMIFTPRRHFVSTKLNIIEDERKINPYWQDWIRARRQDQET